ncbi:helix-turn-helix domain-containing protein [Paractinoplanes lichenicola]|uniref:Helix-turn-helix transcriptional regulator n=1 Tax=Paractinoplanes lichenicola TaxID=2802976 RepID=A0ABS1VK69_9ACTN|nr:AraC family transcriptional regulator [Actinoplanes lichenicola]MBL7255114.1 helix-turn-helix transcriptional regulator [Actinoplanes lichenicola]
MTPETGGEATFVLLRLPVTIAAELAETVDGKPNAELVRLIAATMIAVNPSVPSPVLRRAIAFIHEHPERPMTVSAIAAAGGVGIRGLQTAFRRHLGVTPMTYLRRVRLDRVHRELLAGDPQDGMTVQTVARRWGFVNLGRFAAEYRAEYGCPPSETLRG